MAVQELIHKFFSHPCWWRDNPEACVYKKCMQPRSAISAQATADIHSAFKIRLYTMLTQNMRIQIWEYLDWNSSNKQKTKAFFFLKQQGKMHLYILWAFRQILLLSPQRNCIIPICKRIKYNIHWKARHPFENIVLERQRPRILSSVW